MTLREKLYTTGLTLIGKQPEEKVVVTKKKKDYSSGGFVNIPYLVDETKASTKLLKANEGWVYKNNDVIAKEVSTIEFELFSVKTVGTEIVFNPIISHPLLDILDRFNEFTAASDGFYITDSHKNLAGDSFWYLEGKAPNIKGIYILQPDKVELKLGEPKAGQRIITGYEYKDNVKGKNISQTYEPDEIIHFKNPDPANQYRGKSKVVAAAEAIDTDNYAIEANKSFFRRGLISNFVLSTDKNLTQEQLKQLRSELRSNYSGVSNAFKAMILSGGLKPESIQVSNKDMEFIEQQKWLRDKIMAIFGNTQSVIGVSEDVNRANAEATILNWKRTTIKSEMKAITDTLNEFLVPRFGTNLVLGFKDPVPEDRGTKVDELVKLRSAKIITPNEAREALGYDPVKETGADDLDTMVQSSLAEAPKSLKNVNFVRVLRKNGTFATIQKYYDKQKLKEAAREIAKTLINKKPEVKDTETREHEAFTNDQVWGFHNKQIRVVEAIEDVFRNKAEQFINGLIERAIAQIPNELPETKNKALFDTEEEITRAMIDFRPLLMEASVSAGTQALQFIDSNEPYIAQNMREIVDINIRKFTTSLIETDRDKIVELLTQGLSEGQSVPQIRRRINEYFDEFSKVQANRITRTEVLRASNLATIDAWEQSGLVMAKQWLTAEDDRVCPYCAPMNGEIVDLKTSFFKKGAEYFGNAESPLDLSYGAVKGGNLHVNCRCTLLPVLVGQKAFDAESFAAITTIKTEMGKRIEELESKADKRTKQFKDLKKKYREEKADDKAYIKALEKLSSPKDVEQ